MAESKYAPVRHEHATFLKRAGQKAGFKEAYDALALEYSLVDQLLKARTRAGLSQDAVAARMGTTKSAVSRLESARRHAPSLSTLRRYAKAVGYEVKVRLVRSESDA